LAGKSNDRYYKIPGIQLNPNTLNSIGINENISYIEIYDEWLKAKMDFIFSLPCILWRFPIETISQSEDGFEKIYQNSIILPKWEFNLLTGKKWEVTIKNKVKEIV
ncbi:DUF1926 domain-containing protein, partial [Candidatus Poribacteria bacterium]|nr:DUF1926 domain-containing protein [Candidatus Poribacteria bacterium]